MTYEKICISSNKIHGIIFFIKFNDPKYCGHLVHVHSIQPNINYCTRCALFGEAIK